MRHHKTISYVLITYLLTWVFWTISFIFPVTNGPCRIIGSFMPSILSLIFTIYYQGNIGLKNLLKKLFSFKTSPLIYIFIFSYTLITIYLPLLICNLNGYSYKIRLSSTAAGFNTHSLTEMIICFVAILIMGGPLGEELGWRGFVLPELQRKYNSFISALIIGVIWTLWHTPMFYFHAEGYTNFLQYLLSTICLSIIITWLYNKTKGNLFIVIMFHTIDNFINLIFLSNLMNLFNTSNFYRASYYAVVFIFLIFISIDMMKYSPKHDI